jgi:O-antigen ligase
LSLLTLIFLAFVLGYTAFAKGGVEPVDRYVSALAVALMSVLYWARARKQPAPPLARAARWLLAALIAVFALQVVPLPAGLVGALSPMRAELQRAADPVTDVARWFSLSAVPGASLDLLLTLGACVLVLLTVRHLAWRFGARPWLVAAPLVAVACLEALLAWFQGGEGAARGTYVNRNHLAGLLEMCLPFAVAGGAGILARSRGRLSVRSALAASGAFACGALMLAGVVLSQSRMGFAAALGSLGLMGAVWAAGSLRGRVVTGAVLLAVLAAFLFLPTDALIGRFAEMVSHADTTRPQIWRETLPLIRDYPVFGCGLGSFESCFARYKTVAPLNTVDYAHNDYLQLAAEGGALGFATIFALAAAVVATAARRALVRPRTASSYVALACLGALGALALHSTVDFNLYIPANALAASWTAGLALAPFDPLHYSR